MPHSMMFLSARSMALQIPARFELSDVCKTCFLQTSNRLKDYLMGRTDIVLNMKLSLQLYILILPTLLQILQNEHVQNVIRSECFQVIDLAILYLQLILSVDERAFISCFRHQSM